MLTWLTAHLKELSHDVAHVVTVLTAAWFWYQHSILKEVIEGDLERRKTKEKEPMNIPILSQLVSLIEKLFEAHAPEIVAAATSPEAKALEQAAITAAVQTGVQAASQDPKVQAGIVAYQALQNFKTAINTPPPAAPEAPPIQATL